MVRVSRETEAGEYGYDTILSTAFVPSRSLKVPRLKSQLVGYYHA